VGGAGVTPGAFVVAVQEAGGEFFFEGESLKLRVPKGALPAELRALWPQLKEEVQRYVLRGWPYEEGWATWCARHLELGFCTDCAAEIALFPSEDPRAALCLDCARMQEGPDYDPVIAEMTRVINAKVKERAPSPGVQMALGL
jgi:hypothetical protein